MLLELCVASERILVAVSGGADSLSLLHALQALRDEFQLQLVAAHYDHGLRAESERDAALVNKYCDDLGIHCIVERRVAEVTTTHIEEQARTDRYDFLLRTATAQRCRFVAVGHTADDQTETVLHHILRGTGLKGLGGIPESRPLGNGILLIRPLLSVRRGALETFLHEREFIWLDDPTNTDETLTRNRLRHTLLPQLRLRFNVQVDAALNQLAIQAREADAALQWAARRLAAECVTRESREQTSFVHLDCQPLRDVPVAILTTLFVEIWVQLQWPRQQMSSEHWRKLAALVQHTGHPTGHSLPGKIQAHWRRGRLTLGRSE